MDSTPLTMTALMSFCNKRSLFRLVNNAQLGHGSDSAHHDIAIELRTLYPSLFHISQEASACNTSISWPFFVVAPCAFPNAKNFVSAGL